MQVDSLPKKMILGVALAYIFLMVILPFVNVFIQVGLQAVVRTHHKLMCLAAAVQQAAGLARFCSSLHALRHTASVTKPMTADVLMKVAENNQVLAVKTQNQQKSLTAIAL